MTQRKSAQVIELAKGIRAATRNLPALRELVDDSRALPIYDTVPLGHYLMPIEDSCHAPHLRRGDWAVVDGTARDAALGELHVVLQSAGPTLWQVVPFIEGRDGHTDAAGRMVRLCHLNRPRSPEEARHWRGPYPHSDGPMLAHKLEQQILGRVVGVFVGPKEFTAALYGLPVYRAAGDRQPPRIVGGAP